eukprot:TRINITY_DN15629_c0_g1::TRINITY_DN15629_c0_g1_i1::g.18678::m.18678 TRINITY_DN15629_c0_g1::TRINITY_DN15629_c0_g1_i1::g.18678  ORF type:complete len:183 (+),score=69.28,sp/Q6DER1/MCTS1_XENTR/57.14/2e-69,PUA/PF01472.15/2e-15 TRINITY_DN15629_c0_g1_i1:95-643(+)
MSWFKKFSPEEVGGMTQVKTSVQRGIRSKLVEQMPYLADYVDDILPKKEPMFIAKCAEHVSVVVMNGEPLFYNKRDGPYFPTLRLLHKYPKMLPKLQVDRGAIKFLLSGANVMCPGLTSKGALIPQPLPENTPVAIYAEGKEHCLSIGLTLMSTDDIINVNKGIGVENVHYLNDGLWKNPKM